MLSFVEARARILAGVTRLGRERVPLSAAAGRVLAEEVVAPAPLPPFDHSAMDGYAVRAEDLSSGLTLPVRGESAAGVALPALAPGTAARIFTGAPLPAGADAVIMQEDVRREGDVIAVATIPRAGQHVRRAGEDLARGAVALAAGTRLSPGALGLAATVDRGELVVARAPVVKVLSTGEELRAPGSAGREASIPESNGPMIAALAAACGARVELLPVVGDDAAATEAAIAEALPGCDLLLTIGGVSVGDHDVVKGALERAGVHLDFWKVAIKPGKPLAVGAGRGARVLGLPGNPASAFVTFTLFAAPLIRALQSDARPFPPFRRFTLGARASHKPGRLSFLRSRLADDGTVLPLGNQASGAVTTVAACDALVLLPADVDALRPGEVADVLLLAEV